MATGHPVRQSLEASYQEMQEPFFPNNVIPQGFDAAAVTLHILSNYVDAEQWVVILEQRHEVLALVREQSHYRSACLADSQNFLSRAYRPGI